MRSKQKQKVGKRDRLIPKEEEESRTLEDSGSFSYDGFDINIGSYGANTPRTLWATHTGPSPLLMDVSAVCVCECVCERERAPLNSYILHDAFLSSTISNGVKKEKHMRIYPDIYNPDINKKKKRFWTN